MAAGTSHKRQFFLKLEHKIWIKIFKSFELFNMNLHEFDISRRRSYFRSYKQGYVQKKWGYVRLHKCFFIDYWNYWNYTRIQYSDKVIRLPSFGGHGGSSFTTSSVPLFEFQLKEIQKKILISIFIFSKITKNQNITNFFPKIFFSKIMHDSWHSSENFFFSKIDIFLKNQFFFGK